MPDNSCPDCRGELVDDTTNNRWHITFSTTTSLASGLDDDSFEIDVALSGSSNHQQGLSQNSGVAGGDGRTVYTWIINRPGTPVSGTIEVTHASLGLLDEELEIS